MDEAAHLLFWFNSTEHLRNTQMLKCPKLSFRKILPWPKKFEMSWRAEAESSARSKFKLKKNKTWSHNSSDLNVD